MMSPQRFSGFAGTLIAIGCAIRTFQFVFFTDDDFAVALFLCLAIVLGCWSHAILTDNPPDLGRRR